MKETEDTQRTLSDFCLEVEVGKMGFRVGMAMGLGELGTGILSPSLTSVQL